MSRPALLLDSGRGRYDRRQSREERMSHQRARVLAGTALVFAGSEAATVAAVAKVARVSRNTFYEYFDDLEHARTAAALRARQRLDAALADAQRRARTPVERWRELAQAWFGWVLESPAESRLIVGGEVRGLSEAGHELQAAFTRSLGLMRASGLNTPTPDPVRVIAVAAAGEVLARGLIVETLNTADASSSTPQRPMLERALVDIAVRLLR
jgi:AcrR family transcriptional regulator